jgi:hypothetical protein
MLAQYLFSCLVFQHLRCHSAEFTYTKNTYFFTWLQGGGNAVGLYGGSEEAQRLSSAVHWFGNSLPGTSMEEHHLVEWKCLVEGVLLVGLQITVAYPGNLYVSLPALETRRVKLPHESERVPHVQFGLSQSCLDLYVGCELQILQQCQFTTSHRWGVELSLRMSPHEATVQSLDKFLCVLGMLVMWWRLTAILYLTDILMINVLKRGGKALQLLSSNTY